MGRQVCLTMPYLSPRSIKSKLSSSSITRSSSTSISGAACFALVAFTLYGTFFILLRASLGFINPHYKMPYK